MEETSSLSLAKKLGNTGDTSVAIVHPPKGFSLDLPDGAHRFRSVRKEVDIVLAFFRSTKAIEGEIQNLAAITYPSSSLWISWPKKSSTIDTDLSDHAVRHIVLPLGLVDNKVCAVDDTYTALRFVWRRALRISTPTDL